MLVGGPDADAERGIGLVIEDESRLQGAVGVYGEPCVVGGTVAVG